MGSWGAGRLSIAVAMPMVALITIGSRGAFAVLGTGVLVMAARVSNPENPLYAVKRLEQHVQIPRDAQRGVTGSQSV